MRQLWCDACSGDARYAFDGVRQVYPGSAIGEPAEYARVVRGIVNTPRLEQRVIHINGDPHPLDPSHFECDRCSAQINPGDRAACITVWRADHAEPAAWESAYLNRGRTR